MSEANKALMRRFVEEVQNQHKLDAFEMYFDPAFVNYDSWPGLPDTLEGAKQLHRIIFAAFPDLRMTIQDMAADGDKVWTRKTATGTHRGELLGIPATGKLVSGKVIDVVTYKNGKVTEHWVVADTLSLMQQLGAVPH
jgi:steroid delta-isomerase-like uncharacterized protein